MWRLDNAYYNELLPSEKERYDIKLQCLYGPGTYCNPFGISDQHWVHDVSKWPPAENLEASKRLTNDGTKSM